MSSTSDYSTKSNFEGLGTNDVIDSSSGPLRQVASTLDKNSYSSLERDHQNDGWYKSELPGKEEVARYDAEYFMKIVSLEKHRKVEKFSDSSYENPNIQAVSYVKKRIVDTDQGDSRSNWSKVDKQSVHVEFSKRVSPKRFQHDEKGCSFFTKKMEQEIRKARTDYAMKDAGICSITDCTEVAVSGSLCSVHGQGIRCDIPHCGKLAVSRKRCRRHGGGARCEIPNCTKAAQSGSKACWGHGGGRRCIFEGCSKGVRKNNRCYRHYSMWIEQQARVQ